MKRVITLMVAVLVLAGCNTVAGVGKDVEKAVLARGLRNHLEDRILLNGHRTIVFG